MIFDYYWGGGYFICVLISFLFLRATVKLMIRIGDNDEFLRFLLTLLFFGLFIPIINVLVAIIAVVIWIFKISSYKDLSEKTMNRLFLIRDKSKEER